MNDVLKWAAGVTVSAAAVLGVYVEAFRFARWERQHAPGMPEPLVFRTRPDDGATGVIPNEFIACDLYLPNLGSGVDAGTMNEKHVRMYKIVGDQQELVHGTSNTSGAGDAIVFQPAEPMQPGTKYRFVCEGVRDTSGALFTPYSMTFTTASAAVLSEFPAAFKKVFLPTAQGPIFTGLTMGPDHRLYAGTFDGRIMRYDILDGGMLSAPTVIYTLIKDNKGRDSTTGMRLITGICFDPNGTAEDPVLWLTHGAYGKEAMADWTSKVSRLSGKNLDKCEDYVVGLPRAWRDHLSFKIAFGPDGFMYFNQGSSSSTGAADNKWGLREEHLLTAACLKVDTAAIAGRLAAGQGPVNVKTEGDDGHYDPYAPNAPVTLYATGIRSGFGLLWHSNGHLYSCLNGGAAGGAAPGTPDDLADVPRRPDEARFGKYNGGVVPRVTEVTETMPDLFIDIKPGKYYGHPNLTRGEYVLFGGSPGNGSDHFEVVHDYPTKVMPDRNFEPALWNLGESRSCNGLIEYKSDTFGGALKGKILTTRYSGGKDIMVLTVNDRGAVTETRVGIDGMTQFIDPLDLVEDPANGDLYVSEFGGQRLTLLRPTDGSSKGVYVGKNSNNAK